MVISAESPLPWQPPKCTGSCQISNLDFGVRKKPLQIQTATDTVMASGDLVPPLTFGVADLHCVTEIAGT